MINKKICKHCNTLLTFDYFHKDSKNKDGKQSWCKNCRRIYNKQDKLKIYHKNYYIENSEKLKDYAKKYSKTNKGKYISKINKLNRFTRHDFNYEDWKSLLEETGGVCPICNKFVGIDNLTLDHKIPINAVPINFIYTINDVQPLCRSCNSRKGDKILGEYYEDQIQ